MFPEERRRRIVEILDRKQTVSVVELCALFGVSDMTIRRDLRKLDAQGLLRRTHGGAVSLQPAPSDLSYRARERTQVAEKDAIGRKAAEMIQDGETIILDSGTTVARLAHYLRDKRDLRIITNSVHVINELAQAEGITVIATGGTLRETTISFVGPLAESALRRFHADKLFLATVGLTPEQGLTNSNLYEAEVKATMIEVADEVILLADHTKFGQVSYAVVAPVDVLDVIVTDSGLPQEVRAEYEHRGIRLIVAEVGS